MSRDDLAPGPETATEPTDADRFTNARAIRSTALFEDYTELIADLTEEFGEARITDIARRLGVTHPTANKAVLRLKREGLVISRPYRGVFLTDAGQALAEASRRRHLTVEDFLVALGIDPDTARRDAEGIEHHVSEETLAAFARFVRARGKSAG